MDERSQHGYSMHPQQAASEHTHGQGMPVAQASSPWPGHVPQQPGAPIAGHAPYPGPGQAPGHAAMQHAPASTAPQPQQFQAQPTMQQFQYAASGYVLPGASEGQAPPMSAHGGTIGVPPQYATPQYAVPEHAMQGDMPQQAHVAHGAAYGAPMQQAAYHGGAAAPAMAFDPNAQAWAFPTPNGLQLVQPGATAMVPGTGHGAQGGPAMRRLRWETIVPAAAVLCLIAAIGLFMHDFDKITGRDAASGATPAAATAEPTSTKSEAAPTADAPDVESVLADATTFFRKGQFDQAANLLHPLLDGANPDPKVVALHDKVDAANARNTALLRRLAKERAAKRWTAVIATIGQIEQVRPLDRQLVSLRARARAAIKARAAKAAEAREAAARRNAAPSTSTSGGGASHAGHRTPPVAGGNTGATSGARPPANVPKGDIPKPPTGVPNPTGGTSPGNVMGGGQAAETMCSVDRTARHNGEDHAHAC